MTTSEPPRFCTVDQLLESLVRYARKHHSDVDEVLDDAKRHCLEDADTRPPNLLDPAPYVYVAVSADFAYGAYSSKEVVRKEQYERFIRGYPEKRREIYLGDVNGKHSGESAYWSQLEDDVIEGAEDPWEFLLHTAMAGIKGPCSDFIDTALDRLEDEEEEEGKKSDDDEKEKEEK